jgi:hypothetical protein
VLIGSVRALPLDRRASKANSTSPQTRDLSIRRARQMGISILTSPGSSSRDTGSKGVVKSIDVPDALVFVLSCFLAKD